MTSPSNHGILTGGYIQYIQRKMDIKNTNIKLVDNWEKIFKPMGITREDMLILFPYCMKCDILTGTELIEPYEY